MLPRCLVVAPWEEPAPDHATLAVGPITPAPRVHLDPAKAASALTSLDGDTRLFREFAKVPSHVANRSVEMDAFCNERLAKGQTWNFDGMLHAMTDDAALAALASKQGKARPTYAVARFGESGVPFAIDALEDDARTFEEKVPFIESIEIAKRCVRDCARPPRRVAALAYMSRYPELAALAAVPLAVRKGKSRAGARDALRAHAKEHAMFVAEVAARYGASDAVDLILRTTEPTAAPKLPAFADAAALPALAPKEAVVRLLGILAISPIDDPRPELDDVRAAFDERTLADFAWALFRAWLAAGAPPKEDWAFASLGHFGDDDVARKLAPLVRAFPGEGFHARAALGLDVLAAIGTDVALMHLHAIAQRIKFKALQDKAAERIRAVAKSRGLTEDELADRLVPTLGLDASGSLDLDFGARTFRVAFDESLTPRVRGGDTFLDDLPRVRAGDDVVKAEAAIETWRALVSDAKTLGPAQIGRLELAMSNARRWRARDFRRFIVDHALVVHLARRVMWRAVRSATGFRVDETSALATASDAPFVLDDDDEVILVHPIDATPAELAAFGQVFADYRILQPFEQLGRSVYRASDAELAETRVLRFCGRNCPTYRLLRIDDRAWRRGPVDEDGGGVKTVVKRMGSATATLAFYPGFSPEAPMETPEQTINVLTCDRKLGELAPSQLSDLVRDVERLLA